MFLKPMIAAAALAVAILTTSSAASSQPATFAEQVYSAFQTGELDRWDDFFHEDVVTNSSAAFGVKGRQALKEWAGQFLTAFAVRLDLVDQINAIDENGNGRAVATINLNWTHIAPFYHLQPTGRTGTSVENMIMTVRDGKVIRMEVADTTLDLVIYMHEQGWIFPQNIRPTPIIEGIDRTPRQAEISFQ